MEKLEVDVYETTPSILEDIVEYLEAKKKEAEETVTRTKLLLRAYKLVIKDIEDGFDKGHYQPYDHN